MAILYTPGVIGQEGIVSAFILDVVYNLMMVMVWSSKKSNRSGKCVVVFGVCFERREYLSYQSCFY